MEMSRNQRRKLQKYDDLADHLEKSRQFCEEVATVAEQVKGATGDSLKEAVAAFREQLGRVDCSLAP